MICFLDLITNQEAGLQSLIKLVEVMPSVPVVSLVPQQSAADSAGVTARGGAILPQPFTNDQFRTVMEKLSQLIPELIAEQGHVITVIPAKGGCGASTIAFNLAAQRKKAVYPHYLPTWTR